MTRCWGNVPSTKLGISSEVNPRLEIPSSTFKPNINFRIASDKIGPASSFFAFDISAPKHDEEVYEELAVHIRG